MSLLFNKDESVFDKNGFDDDGWTQEDHDNLVRYGTKNPTAEDIARHEDVKKKETETGGWY